MVSTEDQVKPLVLLTSSCSCFDAIKYLLEERSSVRITSNLANSPEPSTADEENSIKIQNDIIDPIIHYSVGRIYPYIIMPCALFILTLLTAIIILIVLLRK